MGSLDPAPDSLRVGPSQPPLNFVDGNGYIVLRGLVEARDCEVGWNKVMKAWGSGDEKVVAKNFELLSNAARSEEQAKDPALPRRWQSKSTLGSVVGGPLFKKFHPHLTESVIGVGDLHPMTPGSVIVASVGSGPQLPHTTHSTAKRLCVTSCPPSRTLYTRDLTIFYISTLSMLFDICDQSCWQSCVTPVEIRVHVLALCIPVF